MLGPHTTYKPTMSTISQDVCWSFVYRRIPLQCSRSITCTYCRRFIIFVHRVPLQYFGADFEITALIEFWKNSLGGCSWWLPLTIFFYQPRSWERHCWNALGVVPACIFDVNVVWFFLQNQLRIENTEHHCWHALNVLPFCIFYITNSPNTKVNTVWVFSTAAHSSCCCCFLKK